ncbi:MAG: ribonuclease P protein component [Phycisphaerales bacterium]|nr:ribonuclease P protein component [Phycisphaerales bacterium]
MSASRARPLRAGASFRLAGAAQFQRVFANRLRSDLGWIVIHIAPNTLARTRLGLSIGSRVGIAVRRVRVKRMIREAFRLVRSELPSGFDVVVAARSHPPRPLADYTSVIRVEVTRLAAQSTT